MSEEGKKFDAGKPRYDLIPVVPLRGVADVLTMGADKYGDNNWRDGIRWSRMFAAVLRHMYAFWKGEEIDDESGLSHLSHAACGLLMLEEYRLKHRSYDDRADKEGA